MKRVISLILMIAIIISFVPTITFATSQFSDLSKHWAKADIEELAAKGIINGMGDGTFQPEGKVTREQFMKLVVAIWGNPTQSDGNIFYDVSNWATPYIIEGLNRNIINVNDIKEGRYFEPQKPMDRDTVALWITRSLGIETEGNSDFVDSSKIKNKSAVFTAVVDGLIKGYEDNTFRPSNTLTRAEAATLIKRIIRKKNEAEVLRPSKNEVVYSENVKELKSDTYNKLIKINDTTKEITFSNIDDKFKSLKIGDLIYIPKCSNIPTGLAIKLSKVEISGSTAIIAGAAPKLEELFSSIDVAAKVGLTIANVDEKTIPEGVKLTNSKGQTVAEVREEIAQINEKIHYLASLDDYIEINQMINNIDKTIVWDFGSESNTQVAVLGDWEINESGSKNLLNKTIKLGDSNSNGVYGSFSVTADVLVDIYVRGWFADIKDKKIEAKLLTNTNSVLGLKAGAKYSKTWDIGEFAANIYGPIGVNVKFQLVLDASGKIKVEATATHSSEYGMRYQNGNVTKINKFGKPTFNLTAEADGRVSIGPKGIVGIGVSNVPVLGNINAIQANADFGVGIKAKVGIDRKLTIDGASHGKLNTTYTAENTTPDAEGNIHICDLCVEGETFWYMQFGIGLSDELNDLFKSKIYVSTDLPDNKINDWYFSMIGTRPSFGMTECPNIYKKPVIISQTEQIKNVVGKDIELNVQLKQPDLAYIWYKDGKEIPNETQATLKLKLDNNTIGNYTCRVYYKFLNPDLLFAETKVIPVSIQDFEKVPVFTEQPTNMTIKEGQIISLKAVAESSEGGWIEYKWYKDGQEISGAKSSNYAVGKATKENAGRYYCVATIIGYPNLKATSATAIVTVEDEKKEEKSNDGVRGTDNLFNNNSTSGESTNNNNTNNNSSTIRDTNVFGN